MTRADDRITAALLEHVELPDLTGAPLEDLYAGLALVPARRAEAGVDGVAYVGELRRRRVPHEVIQQRTGISVGRAWRWEQLYKTKQQASEQGAAVITGTVVEPGQHWETKDLRDKGRQVRVLTVHEHSDGVRYAQVETVVAAPSRPSARGKTSRVAIVENGPGRGLKGFRLVQHADGSPAGAR